MAGSQITASLLNNVLPYFLFLYTPSLSSAIRIPPLIKILEAAYPEPVSADSKAHDLLFDPEYSLSSVCLQLGGTFESPSKELKSMTAGVPETRIKWF